MQSVPQAGSMERTADQQLRKRIATSNASHHPAAGRPIYNVHLTTDCFENHSRNLTGEHRWHRVADLLILRRARSAEEVVIRERLQPRCLAYSQTSALRRIVMNVV